MGGGRKIDDRNKSITVSAECNHGMLNKKKEWLSKVAGKRGQGLRRVRRRGEVVSVIAHLALQVSVTTGRNQ